MEQNSDSEAWKASVIQRRPLLEDLFERECRVVVMGDVPDPDGDEYLMVAYLPRPNARR